MSKKFIFQVQMLRYCTTVDKQPWWRQHKRKCEVKNCRHDRIESKVPALMNIAENTIMLKSYRDKKKYYKSIIKYIHTFYHIV